MRRKAAGAELGDHCPGSLEVACPAAPGRQRFDDGVLVAPHRVRDLPAPVEPGQGVRTELEHAPAVSEVSDDLVVGVGELHELDESITDRRAASRVALEARSEVGDASEHRRAVPLDYVDAANGDMNSCSQAYRVDHGQRAGPHLGGRT